MSAKQAIVLYLPAQLVRALKPLVGEGRPYADMSELAELSMQNQLALETGRHSQIPGDDNDLEGGLRRPPSLSTRAWVRWYFVWDTTPGTHQLRIRATDEKGNTQPEDAPWNELGYFYSGVVVHPVEVR